MNRNREVRELQFSSSQLIVLFLAILILGIFIFLLGVSVGKKQTRLSQEANLARSPAAESLKRSTPALPATEAQPSAIEQEIASHQRQVVSGTTALPPSGKPTGKTATPVRSAATPTTFPSKSSLTPSLSKSAHPAPAENPKTEAGLAALPKKTAAKPTSTSRVESPQTAAAQPKGVPPVKGYYYIQLAAFDERAAAESFVVDVKAAGFPTLILNPFATDKKPWYRVRVGGYASKEEAEDAVVQLKAALKVKKFEYWIVRG